MRAESSPATRGAVFALTWRSVVARRMARHALVAPSAELDPAGIASLLVGAHAQIRTAGELSIARRIASGTVRDVRRALDDHRLIKTFGPRGTVHLLAARDLPMWIGAMSVLPPTAPQHPEPVRFTDEEADEVIGAVADALERADLTIDELTEAIRQRAGAWAVERTMPAFGDSWPRWRQLTGIAAHRGVLCFGADRGRNVTYASPRRWLPDLAPEDATAALRSLLGRYLYAYGPATPDHFARWLAIPPGRARTLFDDLADGLERVEVDGRAGWVLAGDTETPDGSEAAVRGVRLLPYFDGYVVAGQPRDWLYPGAAAERALTPAGQAGNYPVLLVDGVVGGVWHLRRSGSRLAITVEPFSELTAAQRIELDGEVALIAAAIESEATLTIGTVPVGAHA